jgi:hypothetical protein
MVLNNMRKSVLSVSVAAMSCFLVSGLSAATIPATVTDVTYTAAGTFSTTVVSGEDTLKLAGEPFSISIYGPEGSKPVDTGTGWAMFGPFGMTGEVHSGLLGPTPVNIASDDAQIVQGLGGSYDLFQTAFPVKVVGISLEIDATILVPPGTIAKLGIEPFAATVKLAPGNATVIYSDSGAATTLTVATGTLTAVTGPPPAN